MMPRRPLTPHQKIVRAAKRGAGIRLNAEEVFVLGVLDDAIVQMAINDACEACNLRGCPETCTHKAKDLET